MVGADGRHVAGKAHGMGIIHKSHIEELEDIDMSGKPADGWRLAREIAGTQTQQTGGPSA